MLLQQAKLIASSTATYSIAVIELYKLTPCNDIVINYILSNGKRSFTKKDTRH